MSNTFKPLPDWSEMPININCRAVDSAGYLRLFESEIPVIPSLYMWGENGGSGYDPQVLGRGVEVRPGYEKPQPETQDAPELVVDVYGIKGTTVQIVAYYDEWIITNDDKYMLGSGKYSPREDGVKRFPTPQAAAEFWQVTQKHDKA